MIEIGENSISKAYLGDTEIIKVYKGSDLIYEKSEEGFPTGYTRLQYVSNQSEAYCNTGITVSGDMTFSANLCIYEYYGSSNAYLLGGGENANQTRNSVGLMATSTNKFRSIYRVGETSDVATNVGNWHTIELKSDGFYCDDVLFRSITRTTFTSSRIFYLGSYAYVLSSALGVYIGDCQINDVMFIPALRDSDSVAGFMRMSDNTFLESSSDTPFLAGPVVE